MLYFIIVAAACLAQDAIQAEEVSVVETGARRNLAGAQEGKCVMQDSVGTRHEWINTSPGNDPVEKCRAHCDGYAYFGMACAGQINGMYCTCAETQQVESVAVERPMYECLGECIPAGASTGICNSRTPGSRSDTNCPGMTIDGQLYSEWNGYALGASWRTAYYSVVASVDLTCANGYENVAATVLRSAYVDEDWYDVDTIPDYFSAADKEQACWDLAQLNVPNSVGIIYSPKDGYCRGVNNLDNLLNAFGGWWQDTYSHEQNAKSLCVLTSMIPVPETTTTTTVPETTTTTSTTVPETTTTTTTTSTTSAATTAAGLSSHIQKLQTICDGKHSKAAWGRARFAAKELREECDHTAYRKSVRHLRTKLRKGTNKVNTRHWNRVCKNVVRIEKLFTKNC